MLANWLAGWAVIPAFAAMYFIRTPREEQLMCAEFGEAYREYARRTGRLFPRFTASERSSQPRDE
jgi:protein-S-isoprenylcysteine O-methyltransferase Ste14